MAPTPPAIRRPLALLAAALAPLALTAAVSPVRVTVHNTSVALLLVLVVAGAALAGGRLGGWLATVSGTAWFDFFLTEPYGRFLIFERADLETAAMLLLAGGAVTELSEWGRRQQARASRRQGYLSAVLDTAQQVGEATSVTALISHVERQLVSLLDLDRAVFQLDCRRDLPTLRTDGALARGVQVLDVDRNGLPTGTEIRLDVTNDGTAHGVFLLTAATRVARPDREHRRIAALLADQVGTSLARDRGPRPAQGTNR